MKILTLNNRSFDLNELPEEVDEDTRFSVLDNSNPQEPDFFFMPLIFLESFNSPAILLRIGGHEVQMPLDWCMVVGDKERDHHHDEHEHNNRYNFTPDVEKTRAF